MEFRLWLLLCQLNDFHFIQLLLPGHGHIPGCHTGLVAGHKVFQLCDFLLLALVGSLQLCLLYRIDLLEFVVIAHITVQSLVFHMVHQIDNAV